MSDSVRILAVDGGGTRCRVACESPAGRQMVEVGSANASTDLDGAVRQITNGLGALATRIGLVLDDLRAVPAYLGIAGVVGPDIARTVADRLPLAHVRVADDRAAAVRGAIGTADGAVAHCGTGSFLGVQRNGTIALAGGWGAILGDEVSARWVGRRALKATLDVADGLEEPSGLTAAVIDRFGTTAAIVAFATTATPAAIGALAPLVTHAAQQNDPVARGILREGAAIIAGLLPRMGWTPGMALCLTGGIAGAYAADLPADMAAALTAPQGAPIDGALSLAGDFARELTTCG